MVMKYTKNSIYAGLIALLSLFTISCEDGLIGIENNPSTQDVTILAEPPVWGIEGTGIAPLTKTVRLEDGRTAWSSSDAISVFQGTLGGNRFQLSSINNDGQAIFNGTLDVATGVADGANQSLDFWAVYPYDEGNACFGNGVTLTVKDELTGMAGSFGSGDFPAIGTSSNLAIGFYNVCSGLVFTFSQPNIIAITLQGHNHETIAGKVNVVFDGDGKPVVSGVLEGKESVVFNAPDLNGFVPGKDYFFPILPTEFSNGFDLTFTKTTYSLSDETKYYRAQYQVNRPVSLKRSIFGRVDGFEDGLAFEEFNYTKDDYSEGEIEADRVSIYDTFLLKMTAHSGIYTPMRSLFNMCGDDLFSAGGHFDDQEMNKVLNQFRYDPSSDVVRVSYQRFYSAISEFNRIIDKHRGCQSDLSKKLVAEARVLRAYVYLQLIIGWGNPPFVYYYDSTSSLNPYNCDMDPVCPVTRQQFLEWCARECERALPDLDERTSPTDVEGAYKVTKGFANAVAGKAYLFAEDYSESKIALKKVIDSGKYALVPGNRFWELFHVEGDGNEEKIFEPNLEYNPNAGWQNTSRSTWMESNLYCWRTDHFRRVPCGQYSGNVAGWNGLGVPQEFGDAFFANDGKDSYRFNATFKLIDDAVFNMTYNNSLIDSMSPEEKLNSTEIGIVDASGLYGQSFYLPFKQLVKATDVVSGYNQVVRFNNYTIMRYAEVLLLYAEACLKTSDNTQAKWAINQIQERAGSQTVSSQVNMTVLKREKSYELWFEGCRWPDLVRWGDFDGVINAGSSLPVLYDKLFREPQSEDNDIMWQYGDDSNSRFYTLSLHEAIERGYDVGFKYGKHERFPYPTAEIAANPNLVQNPGW